jgi:hypothetical protein
MLEIIFCHWLFLNSKLGKQIAEIQLLAFVIFSHSSLVNIGLWINEL